MSTSGDRSYSVKRKCRFSDHMKSKYPCFDDGRTEHEARCLVCESYLSVANKGITDLERHVNSEKHRSRVAAFYELKPSPESTKTGAVKRFLPLFDRVLVERFVPEVETNGGIMLPENSQGKVLEATVVAIGEGARTDKGDIIPPSVKVGDKVLLPEFGGTKLNLDDKAWRHSIIFDEWNWNCGGVLTVQLEGHWFEFYPSHCIVPLDKFSSNSNLIFNFYSTTS